MPNSKEFPGAKPRTLPSGNVQWRYRLDRNSRQITLPGDPAASPEFEAAYWEAVAEAKGSRVTGDDQRAVAKAAASQIREDAAALIPKPATANVIALRTFGAAEKLLVQTSEWQANCTQTRQRKELFLRRFLAREVDAGSTLKWRHAPVEGMDYHRLDSLVAEVREQQGGNVAKRYLEVVNDLLRTALNAKWLAYNPSWGVRAPAPKTDGHMEWPREYREQFEAYHPIGSSARTAYVLAYWFGDRREDICTVGKRHIKRVEREDVDGELRDLKVFDFRQSKRGGANKQGKEVFHPILPWVEEQLGDALTAERDTILARLDNGRPFSPKGLTQRFQVWTKQAGLPEGYTAHGLRKSLGNYLAELGLSARIIMEVLGHSTMAAAQVYVDKANKAKLSISAFDEVDRREQKRRQRASLKVVG